LNNYWFCQLLSILL